MKKITLFRIAILLLTTIVYAQDYEIFVSSRGTNSVKQYDAQGNYLGDFVPPGSGGLTSPQDMIFLDENTLIVSGLQNSSIKEYNATNGDYLGNFSSNYSLSQPTRMTIGPDDLIYVLQWSNVNNKVVRFDQDGNFVDEFTSVGIPQSIGLDWDDNGNLYVSSYGQGTNGFVRKFDTLGNDLGIFIDSVILQGPTNIWFDDNGDLLVMDWSLGIVRRFDSNGNYIDDFITGMVNPEGIAFISNGDMLLGDWGTDTVEAFDENGKYLGTFTSGNNLSDPNAVILRDITLSVPDHKKDVVFVTPSIGVRFNINIAVSSEFDQLSVYNSQGQRVDVIEPNTTIWYASSYAEGVYFIIAEDQGKKSSQRIIVKK